MMVQLTITQPQQCFSCIYNMHKKHTTLLIIFCDRYLLDLFGPAFFFPQKVSTYVEQIPSLEGFETITRRYFEKMTYYIIFVALCNGTIKIIFFSKYLLEKGFILSVQGIDTVFSLPFQRKFQNSFLKVRKLLFFSIYISAGRRLADRGRGKSLQHCRNA